MMLQDYSAMEENLSTAKSTESIGAILPALSFYLQKLNNYYSLIIDMNLYDGFNLDGSGNLPN